VVTEVAEGKEGAERMESEYDVQKVNETVLALLYLWSWREYGTHRAWKGFDWEVLDYLHEQGWISDPKSKAKSVILTEEGMVKAQEYVARHFPLAD
jgi:hypothetical protein